jgi:hypothetical protein
MPAAEQCKATQPNIKHLERRVTSRSSAPSPNGSWFTRKGPLMKVYQEKIAPPGALPDHTEPPDVLLFQRTIESVEQENEWLKEQLAGIVRAKKGHLSFLHPRA